MIKLLLGASFLSSFCAIWGAKTFVVVQAKGNPLTTGLTYGIKKTKFKAVATPPTRESSNLGEQAGFLFQIWR